MPDITPSQARELAETFEKDRPSLPMTYIRELAAAALRSLADQVEKLKIDQQATWGTRALVLGIRDLEREVLENSLAAVTKERDALRDALRCLEETCDAVAATRTPTTYEAILKDAGCELLIVLDEARREARAALKETDQAASREGGR